MSTADRAAALPTALLMTAQAATAGGALLVNFLAAFVLDPSGRGELALWLQLGYLLTTIALLGLERPIVAHAEGEFSSVVSLLTRLVRPALLVLVGSAVVAAIWGLGWASELGLLVALMALFAAGNIWVRANRVGYIVSRTWKPFFVTTIGYQVVLIAAAGALVLLDVDAVLAWALVYLVATLFVILHLWTRGRRVVDATVELDIEHRALRRLGIALLPASLGNTAMLRADRLLLPLLSSSAQLGLYVLVATATELASWPVQQYIDVSLRSLRSKRPTSSRRLLMTANGMAVGLGFGIVAALVCWLVIEFALPAYRDSLGLLPPLVIATAIYSGTRVQQGLLIAADRPGRASTVELAGMVAACTAYVVLIPWLGGLGAAWGSVLGYGLALVVGGFVTAGTPAAAAPESGARGQEPGQAADPSS